MLCCHAAQGMMDPAAMQQMMQSPLMQQLLRNPELMRNMLQMNPAVREVRSPSS
jgi:ubiquilin